jgi:hypothetical protein
VQRRSGKRGEVQVILTWNIKKNLVENWHINTTGVPNMVPFKKFHRWTYYIEREKIHDFNLFISPHTYYNYKERENAFIHLNSINYNSTHQNESDQTLQLFPIRNGDHGCTNDDHHHNIINQHKETEISASAINAPNQFIEFLPLKNWLEKTLLCMYVKWQGCLLGVGFCWKIALLLLFLMLCFKKLVM